MQCHCALAIRRKQDKQGWEDHAKASRTGKYTCYVPALERGQGSELVNNSLGGSHRCGTLRSQGGAWLTKT